MKINQYSAEDLFNVFQDENNEIVVLDVRNESKLDDFRINCSTLYDYKHVPYLDFLDNEDQSVSEIPRGKKIVAVCDKTGASKYIAELLALRGYTDTGYLDGGIEQWKTLSVCLPVEKKESYVICRFLIPDSLKCSYGLLSANELYLFDPAGDHEFYLEFIHKNNIDSVRIFLTHSNENTLNVSENLSDITGAEIVGYPDLFGNRKGHYVPAENNQIWHLKDDSVETRVLHVNANGFVHTFYLVDGRFLITGSLRNNLETSYSNIKELYGFLSELSELA